MMGMWRRRVCALLCAAALLLLLAPYSRANVFEIYSAGSRAAPFGGAFAAIADDFSAAFYNPAGLTQASSVEFSSGLFFGNDVIEVNGHNRPTERVTGAVLGFVAPIFKGRGGIGVSAFIPQNLLLTVQTRLPYEPHFPELEDRPHRLAVHLGFGLEITPTLSVGTGFHLLSAQDATNKVFFPINLGMRCDPAGLTPCRPSGGTSFVTNDMNIGAVEAEIRAQQRIAPVAGILWKPFSNFRMGLGYRAEIEWPLRIRLEATNILFVSPDDEAGGSISGSAANGENILLGNIAAITFYSPHQVDFGIAYDPTDNITIAAGFTWAGWQQFEDSNMRATFDETLVSVRTSAFDAASAARVQFIDYQNPEFRDTYSPHVGFEARLPTLHDLPLYGDVESVLRLGWSFIPTAVRDNQDGVDALRAFVGSTGPISGFVGEDFTGQPVEGSGVLLLNTGTNFLGVNRHVFTAGLGLKMKDPLGWAEKIHLDGHVQYHLMQKKSFTNAQYFPGGSGMPGVATLPQATTGPTFNLPDLPNTRELEGDGYLIAGGFTLTLVF